MGYRDLLELSKMRTDRLKVGVVYPDYAEVFKALKEAEPLCFDFILIGPGDAIRTHADAAEFSDYELIKANDSQSASEAAVALAGKGGMDLLMKGSVRTAVLMKAVLHAENGIRGDGLMSHMAVFESPDGRFIGVSDGGLMIEPDVEQKAAVVANAIEFFHHLGVPNPKIALLSGVEVVTPGIQSTVDADELARRADNGEFARAVVEGPMAFDLAFNPAACRAKHYSGQIQGDADVLIVPEIVSGNILGKTLNHAAGYASGGVILGATIPIVLLSRSDRAEEKLNSLLLASVMVDINEY